MVRLQTKSTQTPEYLAYAIYIPINGQITNGAPTINEKKFSEIYIPINGQITNLEYLIKTYTNENNLHSNKWLDYKQQF